MTGRKLGHPRAVSAEDKLKFKKGVTVLRGLPMSTVGIVEYRKQ
jgi:hypothetical protein